MESYIQGTGPKGSIPGKTSRDSINQTLNIRQLHESVNCRVKHKLQIYMAQTADRISRSEIYCEERDELGDVTTNVFMHIDSPPEVKITPHRSLNEERFRYKAASQIVTQPLSQITVASTPQRLRKDDRGSSSAQERVLQVRREKLLEEITTEKAKLASIESEINRLQIQVRSSRSQEMNLPVSLITNPTGAMLETGNAASACPSSDSSISFIYDDDSTSNPSTARSRSIPCVFSSSTGTIVIPEDKYCPGDQSLPGRKPTVTRCIPPRRYSQPLYLRLECYIPYYTKQDVRLISYRICNLFSGP